MADTDFRIAIALAAIRGKIADPYKNSYPLHLFINVTLGELKLKKEGSLALEKLILPEVEAAREQHGYGSFELDLWNQARKQVGKYAINPMWWPSEYDHLFTK